MVIIMIRRFVRADREVQFLDNYRNQAPTKNPAFRGEKLTKVKPIGDLPEGLRELNLGGENCVTYLNIAQWDSWEAFEEHFKPQPNSFDQETETAARQRVVLDVTEGRWLSEANEAGPPLLTRT